MVGEEESPDKKWKDVGDKLETLQDLHNLNQLDIINLNNEIEKIRIATSSPIPPDIEQKIVDLEKIATNVNIMKKWKQTIDEVKFLRSKIMGAPLPRTSVDQSMSSDMGTIRTEIDQMRKEIQGSKFSATEAPKIDIQGLSKAIEENKNTINSLKSMISSDKPQTVNVDLDTVKKMINENRKLVEELKLKVGETFSEVPAETHGEIDSLHEEITKLEEEMKRVKDEKPAEGGDEKISSLRKELFTKLEDLNTKFASEGSDVVKKAVDANKQSIENLKKIMVSEDREVLKKEIDENRKFMEELKRVLMVKNPKTKIVLPDHSADKKKLSEIELKVEALSKKLERMNNLKPIKLPTIPEKGKKSLADVSEIDKLREQLEGTLQKMDGFVTKEEVEKGFLDKRIKSDGKLFKDDIYDEMNEIKKAVMRNEEHINNIVSDVESVKSEVDTVEKREWGKVEDMPTLEELKVRIDELEKKMRTTGSGALLIE
ncbi:MAG: hypothetical protein KAS32_25685 [Candidatus Peribacteraceae bacterium]|nr:hypothetical protein [Candidatus Peribacteraceae bacterium]